MSRVPGGQDERAAQLIRAALILCADHELNASAFAVRVVASTGASLAACVSAGLSALSGPQHGGTTSLVEILFEEVERLGNATRVVQERLRRGDRLPASIIRSTATATRARSPCCRCCRPTRCATRCATPSTRSAASCRTSTSRCVALRRALGLAPGSALVLFAIGRTVGWIAHALEQQCGRQADPPTRALCRRGAGGLRPSGAPIRLISHSSVDARIAPSRAAARSRRALSMSAAVALPRLIRKLQCSSDTCASPTTQAAAAGRVDQLPGLVARRVLEGRAAGAALHRLRRLARFGDLVHLGGDRGRIAGRALKQRLR